MRKIMARGSTENSRSMNCSLIFTKTLTNRVDRQNNGQKPGRCCEWRGTISDEGSEEIDCAWGVEKNKGDQKLIDIVFFWKKSWLFQKLTWTRSATNSCQWWFLHDSLFRPLLDSCRIMLKTAISFRFLKMNELKWGTNNRDDKRTDEHHDEYCR